MIPEEMAYSRVNVETIEKATVMLTHKHAVANIHTTELATPAKIWTEPSRSQSTYAEENTVVHTALKQNIINLREA